MSKKAKYLPGYPIQVQKKFRYYFDILECPSDVSLAIAEGRACYIKKKKGPKGPWKHKTIEYLEGFCPETLGVFCIPTRKWIDPNSRQLKNYQKYV